MLTETQFSFFIVGMIVFFTITFFTISYKRRWLTLLSKALAVFMILACIITLYTLYSY